MVTDINNRVELLKKILVLNRIKILELIMQEETCVCQMVEKLGLKHNLISHHLKTLVDIGFLIGRRKGQHITYRLVESRRNTVTEIMKLINFKK